MWLFVGGSPRSGTTALMSVLNSNNDILISSEENVFRLLKGFRKLCGTKETRENIIAQTGMREVSGREVFAKNDVGINNFSSTFALSLLKSLYNELVTVSGKDNPQVCGDKLPGYHEVIGKVLALDNNVKYLHITRNPFDVINSMLRRTELAKQGKDWWKSHTDVGSMIDVWNSAFVNIRKFESNSNVLHIQYEDLVFSEGNVLSEISDFLGVAVDNKYQLISDKAKHHDQIYLTPEVNAELDDKLLLVEYREYLQGRNSKALELLGY